MNSYKPHSKLLAVGLSILFPGAGHFYVGHIRKAFIFLPLMFFIQYITLYVFTYTVNAFLLIFPLLLILGIYAYSIYTPLKIINQKQDKYTKYNHWSIVFLFFMPITFIVTLFIRDILPIRTFSLPGKNMENTVMSGDVLVANKTNSTLRGELSIFKYPNNPSTYYIKRCVAISEDEVIYIDKQLLIHFHEGDTYIKENYLQKDIISIDNKLWVVNPYMKDNIGIKYKPKYDKNAFEFLIQYINYKPIGMTPKMYTHLDSPKFRVNNQTFNAFYIKLKDNQFFMMGDNRDNSHDSRFWGAVNRDLIYGKPNVVYFNLKRDGTIGWDRIGTKLDKNIVSNNTRSID